LISIPPPQFFETETILKPLPALSLGDTAARGRNYTISYDVTALRKDPNYIR
jgi:hypothetical protein